MFIIVNMSNEVYKGKKRHYILEIFFKIFSKFHTTMMEIYRNLATKKNLQQKYKHNGIQKSR